MRMEFVTAAACRCCDGDNQCHSSICVNNAMFEWICLLALSVASEYVVLRIDEDELVVDLEMMGAM